MMYTLSKNTLIASSLNDVHAIEGNALTSSVFDSYKLAKTRSSCITVSQTVQHKNHATIVNVTPRARRDARDLHTG